MYHGCGNLVDRTAGWQAVQGAEFPFVEWYKVLLRDEMVSCTYRGLSSALMLFLGILWIVANSYRRYAADCWQVCTRRPVGSRPVPNWCRINMHLLKGPCSCQDRCALAPRTMFWEECILTFLVTCCLQLPIPLFIVTAVVD